MNQYIIINFRVSYRFKDELKKHLALFLEITEEEILSFQILRQSLDARQNKKDIYYQYKIRFSTRDCILNLEEKKNITIAPAMEKKEKKNTTVAYDAENPPVIVGYGPAGIFVAYTLIQAGIRPIVIEKGQTVEDRQQTINRLWRYGILNPESNVQFGEGGAGFFSDGKLSTRVNSPHIHEIYKVFIQFGAKPEILYENKPHLGTDKLKVVLKNLREYLTQHGVTFYFNTTVSEILLNQNRHVVGVKTDKGLEFKTNTLFLCTGHSSRKTYRHLHHIGVQLEAKDFAVGFRIEHPQAYINMSQYGAFYDQPELPAANYKLQHHNYEENRGTYSFCMCPGGMVLLATSEENAIVTNGMSLSRRNGKLANAGIVVAVNHEICGNDLFSGVEFQEFIERKAFQMSGSYSAPAQRVIDFLNNRVSIDLPKSSFLPSLKSCNLRELYPEKINQQIIEGMQYFNQKMKGFIHKEAIFIAPETRTSSPLRIVRDAITMESVNTPGLIPLGEGAGAAGGITSAGIEGINGALMWLERNSNG